jgi:hypothetical protein
VLSLATSLLDGLVSARQHALSPRQESALERAAADLASAIMATDVVTLATRVLDRDRTMLMHAIELARLIAPVARAERESSASDVHVIHRGQSGRLIGR